MAVRTITRQRRERIRSDSKDDPGGIPVSYEDDTGDTKTWNGTEIAPYVIVANEGDEAIEVQGNVAHDDPDANNPVKIGGHANAAPRAPVSAENDRADASVDLRGRLRARISGEQGGAGVDVEVGDSTQVAEADNLLGVKDPSLGQTTDAGVTTDGAGSAVAFLRGIIRRASEAALGLFVVGNEPHDDPDTNNPVKIGGHANAGLRPAVGEDDRVDASFDLLGRLRVVTFAGASSALTWSDSLAVSQVTAKAAAGVIYEAIGVNGIAGVAYLQFHNVAAALAGGEVPLMSLPVAPGDVVSFENEFGFPLSVGITVALSSTEATFTAVTGGIHVGFI